MSETTQARPRWRAWPWVAGGVLAAVLAVAAGAVTTLVTREPSDARPTGSAQTQTPVQTPEPVATTPTAPQPVTPIPAACTDAYAPEYIEALEADGYPLNDPTFVLEVGTRDDQLGAIISASPTLRCTWGGASESGLITNVTQIIADQRSTIEARLRELGFSCYPEQEGLRCVTQERIETDGQSSYIGESHFLRDDVWLATLWINFTPDDYTPGMVRTIWPS